MKVRFFAPILGLSACLAVALAGCPPEDPPEEEPDLLCPHAVAKATPRSGCAPMTVTFDGTASSDDAGIESYSWDLDARDGIQADLAGPIAYHHYEEEHAYTATLTVCDTIGKTARATVVVKVGIGLPTVSIQAHPFAGPAPLQVQFTSEAGDPDGGPVSFSWRMDGAVFSNEAAPQYTFPAGTPPGAHEAMLVVTDDEGATALATVSITITEGEIEAAKRVDSCASSNVTVGDPSSPLKGASVLVPKAAVSQPTVITVSGPDHAPAAPFGTVPLVELGPRGKQFSQRVTVSLPVAAEMYESHLPRIVAYDEATQSWVDDGISNVRLEYGAETRLLFETSHFTYFASVVAWAISEVGTLGGLNSYGLGINESSQVVGYSYLYMTVNWRHAFLWGPSSGIQDLSALDKHSFAFGVNDANPVQVVGYCEPEGGSTDFRAFLWDSTNGMQDLGNLGGTSAVAMDINDSGYVAGYGTDASGNMRAFLWDATNGIQDLGTLGGPTAYAFGINDLGQVVGTANPHPTQKDLAFVWDSAGGMVSLGAFPGATHSSAHDINELGEIVGEAETVSGSLHAAFWDAGGIEDLGTLGGATSSARAINDNAHIVGNSETASGSTHAFVWGDEAWSPAMLDLNDLLPAGSGWILIEAWDINNAGDVAGWGRLNGTARAFLLQRQ
jgi:probable HAF family extracellular repeat protein